MGGVDDGWDPLVRFILDLLTEAPNPPRGTLDPRWVVAIPGYKTKTIPRPPSTIPSSSHLIQSAVIAVVRERGSSGELESRRRGIREIRIRCSDHRESTPASSRSFAPGLTHRWELGHRQLLDGAGILPLCGGLRGHMILYLYLG